ncbi:hypothetical protein BD410DRAFT_779995 [Rickenella mellea]|uniref:Uncharacterized protein n=1 Tax=Rickenella mellea TaxID=50990 RepID=A0A4R5XG11_9AGAM|nr:hypothetical protein BD410DRAFT_779995 [Rickenella mellea]
MNYEPRHSHPFTIQEAIQLDIPTITQEISRLQNSLAHLNETQRQLSAYISASATPDEDLQDAFRENEEVISAQGERIEMLKMALEHQGANLSSGHYDISPHPINDVRRAERSDSVQRAPSPPPNNEVQGSEDDSGGIYL